MKLPKIHHCPGTLAESFHTYSRACLKRVFNGRAVSYLLPYTSPTSDERTDELYQENAMRISISGVQTKFSMLLEKNKLRITKQGERGTHILKPISTRIKNAEQLPANEHLTMQVAQQIFSIDTAANALLFFKGGEVAYITKRFDVKDDGSKWQKEDFASLAGKTPQTHGEHYKYTGNYLDMFTLMKQYVPAYNIEAPKLYKLIGFNYLFSNGDAHLKNFSLIENPQGDFRLSPAYDLLNTSLHIADREFALEEGLLPKKMAKGKVMTQFLLLAKQAGLKDKLTNKIWHELLSETENVKRLIDASFLSDKAKRSYLQSYQTRYKKLTRA